MPALYGPVAPYYDRIYAFKDYEAEARKLRALALREIRRPARTLLDVGCGTGRHLESFRRWFEVAGVDGSAAMLRVARRRLGRKVPLVRGDFRRFEAGGPFDVLTCLFSAFGHVGGRASRDRAARNFFRHVAPGGVALVDGWIRPDAFRPRPAGHLLTYEDDTTRIARLSRISLRNGWTRLEMQYLIGEAGQPIRHFREVFREPLLPDGEVLDSFRRAGFVGRALRSPGSRDRSLYVLRRPLEGPAGRR